MAPIGPPPEETPKPGGRWQVPLLIIGLAVLGTGVYRIVASYRPTTFEEELSRVRQLHAAGVLVLANTYLVDLLKEPDRPPEQRAELHRLLAITVYLAELELQEHVRRNAKAILANYEQARRHGATLDVNDWVAQGDAETWMGDTEAAASYYREALRHCPDRPDRLRRKLLEWEARSSSELTPESLADIDAILNGEPDRGGCSETAEASAALPANYLWALEHKIEWLLEQGAVDAARGHIDAGKDRLAGTAEHLALSYLDALCQSREGRAVEAEGTLRSLLAEWNAHDVLWAKSNLLLGRLQQEDDRPQMAMSFYEEVLRAFTSGELHDACLLGRAECLAALEDFEGSLEAFTVLKEGLLGRGRNRYLDRDAVRTTVTTLGESVLHQGRLELGIRYLESAAELVDPSARDRRAWYQTRIADSLSRMARLAAKEAKGGEESGRDSKPAEGHAGPETTSHSANGSREAERLHIKAAEAYLMLADLQMLDEEASARSLELAADSFDAAGLIDRQIEVLSRFAREHLGHNRRVTALYRLGWAYQAEQRYASAAASYEEAISSYPHLPDALRSMVPMAECLIALGGEQAKRGADMLTDIVDDRGPDALFAPQAREYRDALVRLAEYYSRAKEENVPGHLEKAIVRLEEAIAHYPEDGETARWHFLLADAYRGSGRLLASEAESLSVTSERENAKREADRRIERALSAYDRVVALLAPHDAGELSEIEQTYLRTSYLCRGDCLFDLGRYQDAIEAYRETAWRYEGQAGAVSASMQIIHCHLRLGEAVEAGSALARLKWLLRKMPEDAFSVERGMSPKSYYEAMVARMESAGVN
jgi:tetratricopeptide (TPR) repeat protein